MKTSLPKSLSLKTLCSLVLLLLLSSCSVSKKPVEHTKIETPPPPTIESYACGFGLYRFSGVLLCFGNDCTGTGFNTTTFDFRSNKKVIKTLSLKDGLEKVSEGIWTMNENCEIEIVYKDEHQEFYRYHPKIYRLELLNSSRESYKGTLARLTTINQIN